MMSNATNKVADNFIGTNAPDTATLVRLSTEANQIADIHSISAVGITDHKAAALMASTKHTEVNNRPAVW